MEVSVNSKITCNSCNVCVHMCVCVHVCVGIHTYLLYELAYVSVETKKSCNLLSSSWEPGKLIL